MHRLDSCTEWTGYTDKDGRGRVNRRGGGKSPQLVYVWAWEQVNGPVPDGKHLHHKCGNPLCYNVDHLEPKTPREHLAEHRGFTETMCRNGHTGELFIEPSLGTRRCRECMREAVRRYRAKKKAVAA